jgi:hypothetical protein
MSVNLSIFAGVGAQFFTDNGVPLAGGLIYTYAAGTTTPAATYTSNSGATPHPNPIVLDAAGRVPGGEIWLTSGAAYKFVVKTSTGVQIGSYDNVGSAAVGAANIANFTGTGVQTNFSLMLPPISENSTNVYVSGVYQQKDTYYVSGLFIVFSEAPPAATTIEVAYF